MGIASLILGIISLIWGLLLPWTKWIGAVIALIGIVLGALGRKDPAKKGIATGGLVCSIIGLVLCLIVIIACAGLRAGVVAALS